MSFLEMSYMAFETVTSGFAGVSWADATAANKSTEVKSFINFLSIWIWIIIAFFADRTGGSGSLDRVRSLQVSPSLGQLAFRDPPDHDTSEFDFPPGVAILGAPGVPHHDLVSFSDDVLDSDVNIRKTFECSGKILLRAFRAGRQAGRHIRVGPRPSVWNGPTPLAFPTPAAAACATARRRSRPVRRSC